MGLRFRVLSGFVMLAAATCAGAQGSVDLSPPLLPQSFGGWISSGDPAATTASSFSLVNVSKPALGEDNPQRSQITHYERKGRGMTVEAVQFDDKTGALSAYSLVKRAGMHEGTDIGALDSVGENAVLFTVGSSLVLAYPATAEEFPSLKALAAGLPKPAGNKGIAPLLPSFVPQKGLVNGSVRYAIGPLSYAAEGGILPASSLGWDKSAEAITAQYEDRRGKETLTLTIYPTPDIARAHARAIEAALPGMGPGFATAKVRQELELVMLADGTFIPDEAQKMLENIHMHEQLSFDKDVQPVFHTEVQKTANLLVSIFELFGILGGAAVLLGFFLGAGRATIRVWMGKPAAVEAEFLSLHLDRQNKPPSFS